jgi:hypothetical protein
MDTSSTLRSPRSDSPISSSPKSSSTPFAALASRLLHPIRDWLDGFDVRNVKTAHRIAKLIPAQCPFERDVKLLGRTLGHIPPLCKLNPFYEQLVTLRFRALCYLADECGEDIRSYC